MAGNLGARPIGRAGRRSTVPSGDTLAAGSDVEVSVTVRMPAVHLPALGTVGEWSWTARHQQPVDRYGSAR